MKYVVTLKETFASTFVVEAESEEEAVRRVEDDPELEAECGDDRCAVCRREATKEDEDALWVLPAAEES